MSRAKGPDAPHLEITATAHRINDLVAKNDEREAALAQRGGMLNPQGVLELRLEEFFKVTLGERRYLQYVQNFQNVRSDLLDRLEAAVNQAELTKGLQLPGGGKATLLSSPGGGVERGM